MEKLKPPIKPTTIPLKSVEGFLGWVKETVVKQPENQEYEASEYCPILYSPLINLLYRVNGTLPCSGSCKECPLRKGIFSFVQKEIKKIAYSKGLTLEHGADQSLSSEELNKDVWTLSLGTSELRISIEQKNINPKGGWILKAERVEGKKY